MKILIAPDKFKGSADASEVAAALSRGIQRAWPDAILTCIPIADGGEGFAKALAVRMAQARVHDALGREVTADYGWADNTTAVIEMSAATGLWRIAPEERDPMRSSTVGTGELMLDAINRGAQKILIGIGGSATNDGGVGMASAFGYQFLDKNGRPLEPVASAIAGIASIKAPVKLHLPRIIAACDVNNPLLGKNGATLVYGPQKGASMDELQIMERALEHLAGIVARDLGCDHRAACGAGAAGGLGFGLMSFCRAEFRSGFDLVAEVTGLEEAISTSDLVITGEGKIDMQTLNGKGPAGVADLAHKYGKPVIAFAGVHECDGSVKSAGMFNAVYAISHPGISIGESMRNAAALLDAAAYGVVKKIRDGEIPLT